MNSNSTPNVSSLRTIQRVLIVDEQEMIRTILASFLQSWGFTACLARDLIGACHMVVSAGPFDVIICNYDLPDGNAFDLVRWMREQQLGVPAIVPYGSLKPMKAPPADVQMLAKPFDPVELRQAIEDAARKAAERSPRTIRKKSVAAGRR